VKFGFDRRYFPERHGSIPGFEENPAAVVLVDPVAVENVFQIHPGHRRHKNIFVLHPVGQAPNAVVPCPVRSGGTVIPDDGRQITGSKCIVSHGLPLLIILISIFKPSVL
jgi:hypothetical protein